MKVKFIEVGRRKNSWEAECEGELNYEWLYSQVKPNLFSSNIDFVEGRIFAGAHGVGKFEVVKN